MTTQHAAEVVAERLNLMAEDLSYGDEPEVVKLLPGTYVAALVVDCDGQVAFLLGDQERGFVTRGFSPECRVGGMIESEAQR